MKVKILHFRFCDMINACILRDFKLHEILAVAVGAAARTCKPATMARTPVDRGVVTVSSIVARVGQNPPGDHLTRKPAPGGLNGL